MSFIGIDFITSNGISFFGVTESWPNAREFGCLAEANPSDFSSFQNARLAAGGVAVIHRNKRLLKKKKTLSRTKLSQPSQ